MLFCLLACVLGVVSSGAAPVLQTVPGHIPAAAKSQPAVDRLPPTRLLRLAFALPLRNRPALTNLLQRLYDPTRPEYHQFLTPEQFAAEFGPDPADYLALSNFICAHGLKITGVHSNRTLLDATGPVSSIETMLHLALRVYPHPREARTFFAPDAEPALDLATPVLHIAGLDDFVRPRPMNLRPDPVNTNYTKPQTGGTGPGGAYLGNDFRAAYVPGSALNGAGQAVGLVEFDGYFPGDVAAYRHLTGQTQVPLKNILLDGFNGLAGANNAEVALDIDMANAMAPGLSAILVYEGEVPDDVLNRMATDNLARQLSASWLYSTDPATEQIFLQFAAQGQSFFNASGDYDAYPGVISPPADDPNITIVGGTTLSTGTPGGPWLSERVWNWGNATGTGGGISTVYPIPSWQQGVNMSSNQGSTNWRNLPDVALTADNVWVVYDDGASAIFGGTSCAAPLWAGFTALVNQQGAANGRPPQGFINPAIYTLCESSNYGAAFHDIVTGNNTSFYSPTAFLAVPGYDLCTGWGTPTGSNLINLLAPLDNLQILPATGFSASGGVGGPFFGGSETFVLTNIGTALSWSAGVTSPWLRVIPSSGTLAAGNSVMVTVSLSSAANAQPVGAYGGAVFFTNLQDGLGQSRSFTLNVLNSPTITSNPVGQSVIAGTTVSFAVNATGGMPLTYQWLQNGVNLMDGGAVSGSSTATLTIKPVSISSLGFYTVVVSNAAGLADSSPLALLSIIPSPPVITAQPVSQYVLVGGSATLSVGAIGDAPLSYQWQLDSTNLTDGNGLSGSTNSSLTLTGAAAANSGTYSVLVQNHLGAVMSAGAVITVNALADDPLLVNGGFETGDFSGWNLSGNSSFDTVGRDVLYTHSGLYGAELGSIGALGFLGQTISTTPGNAYLLSLWLDSPDGAGPNEFQLNWGGSNILDYTNMPGFGWTNVVVELTATTATTTLALGFRDDASFLGLDDVSLRPLLSPAAAPVITNQPPSRAYVAAGGNLNLTVGAVGQPPLFYQWQSNGAIIPGATASALALTGLNVSQAGTYCVSVSNVFGVTASSNTVVSVFPGNAALLTFDDLGAANLPVPAGYGGLNWSNFYHTDTAVSSPNPSGYIAGTISAPNVAYNQYGTAAILTNATPFDFISASVTAAWNDNLRLEARGYASNAMVYDQAFYLSSTAPTPITFNCIGVTNLTFTTSGGTPNPLYGGSGFEFVMDNVSVIVPTTSPATNGACSNAIVILSDPYTNTQSTAGGGAPDNPVPTCLTNFANGVWYQFTAPAAGEISIDTSASDFNAMTAIYSGNCGALGELACGQSSCAVAALQTVHLLIGASGNITGHLVLKFAFSSPTMGPPFILTPPSGVVVSAGKPATFSLSAEGQPPLYYAWLRNGSAIAGATASSYTLSNPQTNDSGAQFSCVVSNVLGVTNSAGATLIVGPPEQLVLNGGFETGDFSYWSKSGNFEDTFVNNYYVHSGGFGVALGAVGSPAYLSQNLASTPGQLYQVSVWLDSPDGQSPNEFSVAWNGGVLFDGINLPRLGWTNLLFNVSAPSTNVLLQFGFRDDPSFMGMDDVSVLPLMPVLQDIVQSGTNLVFQWSALPANQYQVQMTTNLAQPGWTNLGAPIIATNYNMTTTESIGAATNAQFFRVVLLP